MKHPLLLFLTLLSFFSLSTSIDYTSLVYRGCTNQHLQASTQTQNLKTLLNSLASSSHQTQNTFFSSTSGTSPNAITALYQCRGDLPASDCSTCVAKLRSLTPKLCKYAVAARVQLKGCYLRYELTGFSQVPGTQFLYKICNKASTPSSSGTSSFEKKRNYAFEKLENGIKNNGSSSVLFYSMSYESVYVLGQCEGDLGGSDCGDCVKSACGKAASECGDSISGQIYQQKCYINYNYYGKGVPNLTSSTGTAGSNHHRTQKTVAVVVGGVAALGFVCVLLMFVKSLMKKRGSKHGDFY